MARKMDLIVVVGVSVAAAIGSFLFLGTASAETAITQHPAFRNEGQPSRTLQGGAMRLETSYGRHEAVAKMNQIMFRETIQRLTAPNAFRAERPVLPEAPSPLRREPR